MSELGVCLDGIVGRKIFVTLLKSMGTLYEHRFVSRSVEGTPSSGTLLHRGLSTQLKVGDYLGIWVYEVVTS